ncbi:MAG: peroxiredoxin family protein [bacterium]|nr:peroxiredoxin family protein [bacterium]
MRRKESLGFTVLVDPECETTRTYGLLNEQSGKVPHPTALVIDKQGIVRFVRVDVDYKVRPEPESLHS